MDWVTLKQVEGTGVTRLVAGFNDPGLKGAGPGVLGMDCEPAEPSGYACHVHFPTRGTGHWPGSLDELKRACLKAYGSDAVLALLR